MHADRSRQYRARGRRVTDQGPILGTKPAKQPEPAHAAAITAQPANIIAGVRVTVCHRCGQPVSDWSARRQFVDRADAGSLPSRADRHLDIGN
jgi:hypothetical protein